MKKYLLVLAALLSVSYFSNAQNYILYGVTSAGGTYGNGVIFSYNITTGACNPLVSLNDPVTGSNSRTNLVVDPDNGLLYGMTSTGGTSSAGVLFSYDT